MVFDVDESTFPQRVLERSRELPVVVDFWAAWCGPCRTLTPALEQAAAAREGQVELAKLDVDRNPLLAQLYRVQGIPAVKGFRDGKVVAEFTGALPPQRVEAFFDSLVPSEAELLARSGAEGGDEAALRRALELDPRNTEAAVALGRLLLGRGEAEAVEELLEPFRHDFVAAGLLARASLEAEGAGLDGAFEAWDGGEHAAALEELQRAFAKAEDGRRDLIRQAMVAMFTELGPDHELAREHRRRLSSALY